MNVRASQDTPLVLALVNGMVSKAQASDPRLGAL